jgi:hypothetical protein
LTFVRSRAQVLHEFVSLLQRRPKSRFFGLVQKTNLAATIDTRLIHAANGVFRELACLHCAA